MLQAVQFAQTNLSLILFVLLIASVAFALGLLSRRRPVIQVLPAPVTVHAAEPRLMAAIAPDRTEFVSDPGAVRQALRISEQTLKELENFAHGIMHILTDVPGPERRILLAILDHMESHHEPDPWFSYMRAKIRNAATNHELHRCAVEMVRYAHHH